jgi:hypothetical protein
LQTRFLFLPQSHQLVLAPKPSPGRITYDLRRPRFHGLIERIPKTHRYRITAKGLRTALFYTRLYDRSLRNGLAIISPAAINPTLPMAKQGIVAAELVVRGPPGPISTRTPSTQGRACLAVAIEGSFTGAAKRLNATDIQALANPGEPQLSIAAVLLRS